MRRCLRVLVYEDAEMSHSFDLRDRRGDILYYYSVVVSPVNFVIHGFLEGYSNSFTHTREKERGAYHGL